MVAEARTRTMQSRLDMGRLVHGSRLGHLCLRAYLNTRLLFIVADTLGADLLEQAAHLLHGLRRRLLLRSLHPRPLHTLLGESIRPDRLVIPLYR